MTDVLPEKGASIDAFTGKIWWADALDLLARLPDKSVNAVISDIPYGEVNRVDSGLRRLSKDNADVVTFDLEHLALQLARVSSEWVVLFCGIEQVSILKALWRDLGMVRLLIWHKPNPTPLNCGYTWLSDIECCVVLRKGGATFNRFYESSVLKFEAGASKEHPTQKPLRLIEYLIESVTNLNDICLDPFSGSGTTAIACTNLDRRFICADLHEPYVLASRERLARHDPMRDSPLKNGMVQKSLFPFDTPPD